VLQVPVSAADAAELDQKIARNIQQVCVYHEDGSDGQDL
jgi:hypothetical protein